MPFFNPPQRDIPRLTIKQNMLWNTAGCFTYQACQWLITIVVVRLSMDYQNSGYLAFAMAIGNIFYPIATYNVRVFQISDVHNVYSPPQYVGFRIFTVILAYILLTIYLLITANSMVLIVTSLIWLVFKADESFCCVYYAIEQKADRMDYIGISQGVRGVLGLIAFSVVLALSANLNFAIAAMALICIIITCVYDHRKASFIIFSAPGINWETIKKLLRQLLPAVGTLVCYGAVVSVSRQLFEMGYGESALGIYASVATPTVIIQVMASYLYSPFLGKLSSYWDTGELKGFVSNFLKIIAAILAVLAVGIVLALLIGEPVLVFLFGESIRSAAYLLTPALVATACSAIMGIMLDTLVVMRKLLAGFVSNFVALACSAALTYPLAAAFYMNGINLTIIVSFLIGIVIAAVFFLRAIREKQRQNAHAAD